MPDQKIAAATSAATKPAEAKQPATVPFQLNHHCRLNGANGSPGDVINVTPEIAAKLTERKGGSVVETR